MREVLLQLIYDYSTQHKLADIDFITQVLNTIVPSIKLNSYVNKLYIFNEGIPIKNDEIVVATYNFYDKYLTFYLLAFNIIINKIPSFINKMSDTEKVFYKNLKALQIILHEIEHAKQNKMINSTINNDEALLLRLCRQTSPIDLGKNNFNRLLKQGYTNKQIMDFIHSQQLLLNQNSKICPHERMAEIKSFLEIDKIIEPMKNDFPYLNTIFVTHIFDRLLSGYEKRQNDVLSPTIEYFNNIRMSKLLNNLNFFKQNKEETLLQAITAYDLSERLMYGYPITNKEYQNIQQTSNISSKRLILNN